MSCFANINTLSPNGRWAISYCTKHPGKDAVGACCECGHLVCKACYNELSDKVYCGSCANKLFTLKTPGQAMPPPQGIPKAGEPVKPAAPKAAEPQQPPIAKAPEPIKPVAPKTAESQQPAIAKAPEPPRPSAHITPEKIEEPLQTRPMLASPPEPSPQVAPMKQPAAIAEPARIAITPKPEVAAAPEPPAAQPKAVPKEKIILAKESGPSGNIWWLAPVLLAFIGGLLAWFMNRAKEPKKALMMLWAGLGLTAVYAAVIFLVLFLPALTANSASQGTIIYSRFRDGSWQIDIMRPDGRNPSTFTISDNVNKYYNVQPSWSAAAGKIAFCTNRDGNSEIYSADADGGNQTNLTNNNYADYQPDWAPDSKKIAFASTRDGNGEIYTINADGSSVQRLTSSKPTDERPRWSPDGKKISFNTDRDGNFEIYVMDSDGNNQQRLTTNESVDYNARWSPDGKKMVFTSERDGNPEVYIMDATRINQKRLTFNSAKDYGPCFSPDGSRIAYYSNTDGNDEIYVMNTDGGSQVRLTNNKDADQSPLWVSSTLKGPFLTTLPPLAAKLLGSDVSTNNKNASSEDYVHYAKFTAANSGTINIIKVYSTKAGNVKAAIYEHDTKTDLPARKLNSNDSPTACAANQWNNVSISSTSVKSGTAYWLAFNSDTSGVVMNGTGTTKLLYKKATFEDYTFSDTAETGPAAPTYDVSISGCGIQVDQDDK